MTEATGSAALQVSYSSREAFLEDYDGELSQGRAAVEVEQPLPLEERVELRVSFPGLRAPLRLRGVVRGVERTGAGRPRLRLELARGSAAWARVEQQVAQIRSGDPALMLPVLRVLLVEDNPHVARLFREGLESYGRRSGQGSDFAITYATNGQEALDKLTSSPCDLLLADVYLPVLDGERLMRIVRSDPSLADLPIVAFSAGGDDARERALSAGADCFLEKPVRLADLLRALHRALEGRGSRRRIS